VRLQVEMAIHERQGTVGGFWKPRGSYSAVQDEAQAILQSLRMAGLAARAPVELAYGEQRLVEIALAMAKQTVQRNHWLGQYGANEECRRNWIH
jgi:branched-chain amino acid transport system ATP-binding protein